MCPAGHFSTEQDPSDAHPYRLEVTFDRPTCEECALFHQCPARLNRAEDGYVLTVDLTATNLERRRRAELHLGAFDRVAGRVARRSALLRRIAHVATRRRLLHLVGRHRHGAFLRFARLLGCHRLLRHHLLGKLLLRHRLLHRLHLLRRLVHHLLRVHAL